MANSDTATRWVRVHFPDPAPGTWPYDADFRDRYEGKRGKVLRTDVPDEDPRREAVLVMMGDSVELFARNELVRVCDECGNDLDETTSLCSWRYCPTRP